MIEIDYIVPMVFPDDHEWQRDLRRASRGSYSDPDGVRYRSWGTEQLLIQCIRKFIPWVRDIIILLARESQVQPWMKNVRIVFHRDFMPSDALPTFNSRAMEMFLHCIPGLSDYFLYANDDMFPLAPLAVEDFFRDGMPCQHMELKDFPECPNNFQIACLGGLNFVAEEFGLHFNNKWIKNGHSVAPILKSSCEHLWQRSPDRIMASLSPFREPKNFNQYIYSWYQHFSGKYVDYMPKCCLLKAHIHTPEQMVAAILDPQNQIVCINDNENCPDYHRHAAMVADAINRRLNS